MAHVFSRLTLLTEQLQQHIIQQGHGWHNFSLLSCGGLVSTGEVMPRLGHALKFCQSIRP